jgi:hypothetical protein
MASTYTANLKIELITPGEQSGAWGATTNNNFTNSIEQAIVGQASVSFPSNADLTLTLTDQPASVAQSARSFFLAVTSAVSLTTTRTLTLPAINKTYLISNGTTGSQAISVARTGGGTTVTVPNGARVLVYASSTGVAPQVTHVPALTVGSTGASADTVVTAGGTQTLTNKTLTTPVISSISNSGTVTIPTGTDTLVNLTGTQTLTNKSFLSPQTGFAAAPPYSFTGDTDTGMYRRNPNELAFSVGGAEKLVISASAVTFASVSIGAGGGNVFGNVAIGPFALNSNTTGASHSAIGSSALQNNTTGTGNTSVGALALSSNTTGGRSVAIGTEALLNSNGDYNVGIGHRAGDVITTGTSNIVVGTFSDTSSATVSGEIVIGNSLTGKGANTAFIGGGSGAYNEKNVTTWETTSDARIKKNIVDNNDGLALIEQVRVRNFEYRTPAEITELPKAAAIDKPGVQLGVIAQELQGVLPSCVTENSTGVLSVSTDPLVWYLINAVQELSARVKELESRE